MHTKTSRVEHEGVSNKEVSIIAITSLTCQKTTKNFDIISYFELEIFYMISIGNRVNFFIWLGTHKVVLF